MHWVLYWLYFLLLLVTDICGLVLAAFTLPGLWLMLAGAAIYAWLTHGEYLGVHTLITLLILAGSAEIAEIFLSGAGAKKAGASKWGMLGGLAGGIVGGICLSWLIPVIGTIVGICLGSFAGAFTIEMALGQPLSQSALIGYGAAKGRFSGILSKIAFGLVMLVITFCTAMPFHLFKPAGSSAVPAITVPSTTPTTQAH